jgi:hypothetical protein
MLKPFLVVCVATWVALSQSALTEDRTVVSSGFAGTTPGGRVARHFLGIPDEAKCIKITWDLTLDGEHARQGPRQYKLVARRGHLAPGRPGMVEEAKDAIEMRGTWHIARATKSDPQAVVYELASDDPERTAAFVKVGDDVLHLLDDERRAIPGNSAWSYALNRNGKEH